MCVSVLYEIYIYTESIENIFPFYSFDVVCLISVWYYLDDDDDDDGMMLIRVQE